MDILVSNLTILGRYQGVPLALALLSVLSRARPWRSRLKDPVVLFWLASLVFLPVGLAKVGSNWNYWIELAAATAVLASCGVWRFALRGGMPRLSRLAASVGLLAVLASPRWLLPPAADLGTVLDRMLHPDQRQVTEFAAVLERVRAEPRGVLAEPLDIVILAGRDILLEPYIFSILNQRLGPSLFFGGGYWPPGPSPHLTIRSFLFLPQPPPQTLPRLPRVVGGVPVGPLAGRGKTPTPARLGSSGEVG